MGEEVRLAAMIDLLNFHREGNESIDAMSVRFLALRHRAMAHGANLGMTWEGYAWLLLRACQCNANQLVQLLQPCAGRFPQNEPEFQALTL